MPGQANIYFFIKSMNQAKNAWNTLMTTKHCFLSITIFLCDICMEVSNCVRNKRQVIHSFFDDRTIKGNRHVLPAMCVSFKTIVSYNIMSHKLVIFSKVYFLKSFLAIVIISKCILCQHFSYIWYNLCIFYDDK